MKKKILITGGSGLVGTHLTKLLIEQGHEVTHLSRKSGNKNGVQRFRWDISKSYVDPAALEGVDTIVHLAGANIAKLPWTESRKKEIITSRVRGLQILRELIVSKNHIVTALISASALGHYIPNTGKLLDEEAPGRRDFLGEVTLAWEHEAQLWKKHGIRVAINRIGIVFANEDGAFPPIKKMTNLRIGAYFGDGKQVYSWIHISDLVKMIAFEIDNVQISGVFNAVAPEPSSLHHIIKTISMVTGKKLFWIRAPGVFIKIILGERSNLLIESVMLSSKKIEQSGFIFDYPNLVDAIEELI